MIQGCVETRESDLFLAAHNPLLMTYTALRPHAVSSKELFIGTTFERSQFPDQPPVEETALHACLSQGHRQCLVLLYDQKRPDTPLM